MLELRNITAGYKNKNFILHDLHLNVDSNEVLAILGQNGSGKSTLAKSIMNLVPYLAGSIKYEGRQICKSKPHIITKSGIGFFMQGGRIFPNLTVAENLIFAYGYLNKKDFNTRLECLKTYFEFFNKSGLNIKATYLSGGEQHQLALAMVLMKKPRFLILDEPSAGLSPVNIKSLYNALYRIKEDEVKSILIIEQNVNAAIEFSDRVVLLREGIITRQEISKNLNSPEMIDDFFFGKI